MRVCVNACVCMCVCARYKHGVCRAYVYVVEHLITYIDQTITPVLKYEFESTIAAYIYTQIYM